MNCRNCDKEYFLTEGEFCSRSCEISFWKGAGIDIMTEKEKQKIVPCVICKKPIKINEFGGANNKGLYHKKCLMSVMLEKRKANIHLKTNEKDCHE